MSLALEKLKKAQERALRIRPRVGGFPVLAEVLREAGVTHNIWILPACQSLYLTQFGSVVTLMPPLVVGMADVPAFSEKALIQALRQDQAGEISFPDFLKAAWAAGVARYDVDFERRQVNYYGGRDEFYSETYPAVDLSSLA